MTIHSKSKDAASLEEKKSVKYAAARLETLKRFEEELNEGERT